MQEKDVPLSHILAMASASHSPTLCMSCGGEFLFGPGNPCTKCSKMSSAVSESEKQAIMVNGVKLTKEN